MGTHCVVSGFDFIWAKEDIKIIVIIFNFAG
jgi:hypothetical protein